MNQKDRERFESKFERRGEDECWPWIAGLNSKGYGQFYLQRENTIAPRVAFALYKGPIPPGLLVCHNCPGGDNPACVNPRHLWAGTITDNNRDKIAKGRANMPSGERHFSRTHPEKTAKGTTLPQSKLTDDKVREIRERAMDGEDHPSIAAAFRVSRPTISRVVSRKFWRHVL